MFTQDNFKVINAKSVVSQEGMWLIWREPRLLYVDQEGPPPEYRGSGL